MLEMILKVPVGVEAVARLERNSSVHLVVAWLVEIEEVVGVLVELVDVDKVLVELVGPG